jgi:integrase
MNQKKILSLNKDLVQGESRAFSSWLEENTFISLGTHRLYLYMFKSFIKFAKRRKEVSREVCVLFLKKHPRQYVVSMIKYYLEYSQLDIKLPKLKEPPKKHKKEFSRGELSKHLIELEGYVAQKISNSEAKKDILFIFKLLYWTGARSREIITLRVKDLELPGNLIQFKKKGGDRGENLIPLELKKELLSYATVDKGLLGKEEIFFINCKGRMDPAGSKYRVLRYYLDTYLSETPEIAALFKNTHNFRRGMINEILLKTGDVYKASRQANHLHIGTTVRYIQESTRKKIDKENFKMLEGLENGRG